MTQPQRPGTTGSHRALRVLLGRSGALEYERLLFFSDAVFAIALTLLVTNFRAPQGAGTNELLAHGLTEQLGTLISFILTVAIVGRYWIGHHEMFQYIRGFDLTLAMLNFAFLGCIAFLPFPMSVLGAYGTTTAVVFYAIAMTAVGLSQTAEWLYAWRVGHPKIPPIPTDVGWLYTLLIVRVPVVFMISIPIAFANPTAAEITWVAILIPGLLLRKRKRRALAARETAAD